MTNLWPILYHFAIGFLMAFIGLMSPGMLTISTLNAAIDRGPKSANYHSSTFGIIRR